MSNWNEVRLGDLVEVNPEALSVSKYKGAIQYIDISSVNCGQLDGYTEYDIGDAPSRARRIIKENDIIYSTVRPNLRAYYYVKDCPANAICSTGFAVLRAKENVNSRFVYSLVTENSFVNYLTLVAKGSAYPAVDTADFKKAKVTVPNSTTQEKIADILSTYDELIENNNKRIKLLEQMAENLYKEWFVRFRFPNHENTEFENGLPKEWEIKRIDALAKVGAGGDAPQDYSPVRTAEYPIPIFSNGIANDGLYGYTKKATKQAKSITISARGTVGFTCLRFEPYLPIVRLLSIEPDSKFIDVYYLYHNLKNENIDGYGTSQQQITIPYFKKKKVIVPPIKLQNQYSLLVEDIYSQINTLKNVNINLIKQRDLLLPRLMSGKLEV